MGDRWRDGHPERNRDPYIARIHQDTLPSSASYNERFQQRAISTSFETKGISSLQNVFTHAEEKL